MIPAESFEFAKRMRADADVHVAALEAYAWDLPMLVAHGLVDSVAVLNSAQQLDGDTTSVGQGRPTQEERHQRTGGVGMYAQDIYFRLLNCGLRMAPSTASGSGNGDNPPGYNRTYVFCGQDFSPATWWRNLKRGRVVVSNGPLLRARANKELPGHVFQADEGDKVVLDIECQLATRQKIEYLEIVKNGRVTESIRLDKWAAQRGRLPLIEFDRSGWMAVRVVAHSEHGFRCAHTGPFYVEIGQPHISKQAAEFFLAWEYDRARQIRKSGADAKEIRARLVPHRKSRDFWQHLVDTATAP